VSGGGCAPRGRLLDRLAPTIDRLRQRTVVQVGLRPYDVVMVWTRSTGEERGEGYERVLRAVPILPAPKVEDLTTVALQPYNAGILPVGSVRLSAITLQLTEDDLRGRTVPGRPYLAGCGGFRFGVGAPPEALARTEAEWIGHGAPEPGHAMPQPFDFYYEVRDASSASSCPQRYRIFSAPFRRPERFGWNLILERIGTEDGR
jgi:hypothetical protein